MIKLKEIIVQLKDENYQQIERNLVKSKADKFLYLFNSYKQSTFSDKEIKENLGISSNSFFVLKSRLFDKIQDSLSCDLFSDHEKAIKMLLNVPEFCLNTPRETASAYLLKLEKDLLRFDMHNELLVIYSALKKMHINSDKYYHYSQLYNKQVSYGLSLEKAEDLLGDFVRILSQYDFSRSEELHEKLYYLKKEVDNIYTFCQSSKIELIRNLITIQLFIFGKEKQSFDTNIHELLQSTRAIIDQLPLTVIQKKWEVVLDYLCFEYYYSIGSNREASMYYEKVNGKLSNFLLFNHVGLVSVFLITKIKFCTEFNRKEEINEILDLDKFLSDKSDKHSQVNIRLYNAMVYFSQQKYTDAITCLNDLNNEFVFKDYFHQFLNLKLTLIYFYKTIGAFDNAHICLKMLLRRIKDEHTGYSFVGYLLKAFNLEINKERTLSNTIKQKEFLILFLAGNKNSRFEILAHILPKLKENNQS